MAKRTRWYHSLLFLSTVAVVGVAAIVGTLFIGRTILATDERTQLQSAASLRELLDTVESTVSIACLSRIHRWRPRWFMACLKNSAVLGVVIEVDSKELSRGFRETATPAATQQATEKRLDRTIHSPFDAGEAGRAMSIYPNVEGLQRVVNQDVRFVATLLVLQLIAVVAAIVVVVLRLIVRPIKGMSAHLHRMDATAGTSWAARWSGAHRSRPPDRRHQRPCRPPGDLARRRAPIAAAG